MFSAFQHYPRPLRIACSLLFGNAALLLIWWLLFPNSVQSNGGQVFFILLWLFAGCGLLLGEGWIRAGIACMLGVFVWGLSNEPSLLDGILSINLADWLSKFVAFAAVVLLYSPTSQKWFASKREEAAAADDDDT